MEIGVMTLGVAMIMILLVALYSNESCEEKCPKCGKRLSYGHRLHMDQEGGYYYSDLLEPYCKDCGWPDEE